MSDLPAERRDAAVSRLLDLDLPVMLDKLPAVRFAKSQAAEDAEVQADFLESLIQIVCSQLLPAACGHMVVFECCLGTVTGDIGSRLPDGFLSMKADMVHRRLTVNLRPFLESGMSDAQRQVAICLSLLGELFGSPPVRELQVAMSGRLPGTRFSRGEVRMSMALELKV